METESNFLIVDVRSPENFQEGHIKNAINIPLDDIEKRKNEIPVWKKIIFCDKDGLWAFKASVKMFDLGYTKNYILSNGIDDWKNKGYEIVK